MDALIEVLQREARYKRRMARTARTALKRERLLGEADGLDRAAGVLGITVLMAVKVKPKRSKK